MGTTKLIMISFMVASLVFSLLYIMFPTILTKPISRFNPISTGNTIFVPNVDQNPYPVTFAYLISASKGDVGKLKRLLLALYHPGNYYLIHLDQEAPATEQRELAAFVAEEEVFGLVGNVWIVGRPNLVTYRGSTMLATTLHGMAILLRSFKYWDWFINLSASDYPLVTQDDLMDAFSELPKGLNFIQHSSHLGWKLNRRGKPIMIDPALYSLNKSDIWWVIKRRSLPTAFKLYTDAFQLVWGGPCRFGLNDCCMSARYLSRLWERKSSAWTILSRPFAEYCILGYENLPRTLLLYYTNFVSSPEGYFQTVVCNSEEYKNMTVNHDLHYISWDNPPKQHPRSLGTKDYRRMILSGLPFARKFKEKNPVLDWIDKEILKRHNGGFNYGGWCSTSESSGKSQRACSNLKIENYGVLRPGPGSRRLKNLLKKTFSSRFYKRQCR